MKKLSDVLAFVQSGGRPVVTFNDKIADCEAYAEAGMKARIVGGRQNDTNVIKLDLDYSEFDAHNVALESRNYFDKDGVPSLTARESGYYKRIEGVYLTPTDDTDWLFSIEPEASAQLFVEFQKTQANGTSSYVSWLEASLLEARARPGQTTRSVLQAVSAIAGDAFDGLKEFYPSVLTNERRPYMIINAVAEAYSKSKTGGPEVSYDVFKSTIERTAEADTANLADWNDIAEQVCDDLVAYYPRVLAEEGRVEFIDRALERVAGHGSYPEVGDREEARDRVKQLIAGDAAQRPAPRAESPAS